MNKIIMNKYFNLIEERNLTYSDRNIIANHLKEIDTEIKLFDVTITDKSGGVLYFTEDVSGIKFQNIGRAVNYAKFFIDTINRLNNNE